MLKYWLKTYGCQMNHSDSERIAAVLEKINYRPTSNINEADLMLINACSVRQSAIDRIWGQTKGFVKLKNQKSRLRPSGFGGQAKPITILTGCILKKDKRKFSERFDLILDIKDLPRIPSLLKINQQIRPPKNYLEIKPKYKTSFRAYLPIMTGCNNFCTYCAVPYTRGREVSRPTEEIICQAKNLIKKGYKEIWLLGENVNSYSWNMEHGTWNKVNFSKLLRMVNAISGNFWIRFTSPHPKDFSDELIDVIAKHKKITEYINLPVQSGDDEILRSMKRPYTVNQYKSLVKKIRNKIPNISISTDVIVGFPKETKRQFENTFNLFKELGFDMAYISQYSPRPGTAAEKMKDSVPHLEKERRDKALTKILKETALGNNKQYIGKEVEVLIDGIKNTFLIGKTKTYKTVRFPIVKTSDLNLIGQFVKVKIIDALPWGLKGEMVK